MEILDDIWGTGTSLNCLQMACRGIVVFLMALLMIRVSGRRSFGIGTALDNIIVILLGAILSRAVVGASPFLPVLTTCFAVVLLHRVFSWLKVRSRRFSHFVEGDKITLLKDGALLKANMDKALVSEEDVRQGLRESAQLDDLKKVEMIFMERNGEISIIKKDDK